MNEKIGQNPFYSLLWHIGRRYVCLERWVRAVIDEVVASTCSACVRVCCQPSYCRETLRNPWYFFLHEQFGNSGDIPWERRDPPPGLGPDGCIIRAGRYAYCYAYNCRAIRERIGSSKQMKIFQEISDLLKDVGLHFTEKRHLTDLRTWDEITLERLKRLDKKIEVGTARFIELRSHLSIMKPG